MFVYEASGLRSAAGEASGYGEVAASDVTASTGRVSSTGGVVKGLESADVERGLGRGGPVRTAVELAARGSEAPMVGIATFAVVLFHDGRVDVDVVSATRDRAEWERLAPTIRAEIAKRPVRVAGRARALRVVVRVEASGQFPGGARPPPTNGTGFAARGSLGGVMESKDQIDIKLPSALLSYRTRKCEAALGLSASGVGFGAGCAVGATQRVVSARVVEEGRL